MKLFFLVLMVLSFNAWADRVMPNGINGTVTLTEKPCNLDIHYKNEPLKLVIATQVIDGKTNILKACYMESQPNLVAVADDELLSVFPVVNILIEEGRVYTSPLSDFDNAML